MRFGFVAASLSAHLAVVGLAWRFAPEGLPPLRSPHGLSGLQTEEFDVAPWVQPARQKAQGQAGENAEKPPTEPAEPEKIARSAQEPPRKQTPANKAPATRTQPLIKGGQPGFPTPAKETAGTTGDWLSIDQQLPDPGAESNEPGAATPPPRDALVERLLDKERDRAQLAARDEASRRAAERRTTAEGSPRNPEESSVNQKASTEGLASQSEAWGESRAQADVWVELTRWLPRAASGDPAWERLPTNTRYDFDVAITTDGGKIVDAKVTSRAPGEAEKLLRNASHLMSRGRYGGTGRQVHRFELRVRLSSTQGRDLWIAHTTPDPPKPGVGSFIAPSGRRFDVWVSVVE